MSALRGWDLNTSLVLWSFPEDHEVTRGSWFLGLAGRRVWTHRAAAEKGLSRSQVCYTQYTPPLLGTRWVSS